MAQIPVGHTFNRDTCRASDVALEPVKVLVDRSRLPSCVGEDRCIEWLDSPFRCKQEEGGRLHSRSKGENTSAWGLGAVRGTNRPGGFWRSERPAQPPRPGEEVTPVRARL